MILQCPKRVVESQQMPALQPVVCTVIETRHPQDPEMGWRILTNRTVHCFEEAQSILQIYQKRWLIECFHRVLKTGYQVEQARLKDRKR